jgi:hypothetical protein
MSHVGRDVEHQLSLIKREPGQSDENLAEVLYNVQMEVLSANAGCDLVTDDPKDPFRWENLDADTKKGWLKLASTKTN